MQTMNGKQKVAYVISERIEDGQVIGFGTGSTVREIFPFLRERIEREGLSVRGVATSIDTARLACAAGVVVLDPRSCPPLSFAVDGADEVDPQLNLIKGGGAAMVAEKIVAAMAEKFVVIVTEDKLVPILGTKFLVPVAVLPFAQPLVERELRTLGATEVVAREGKGKIGPLTDDFGNVVFDVRFPDLSAQLAILINSIPGVVGHGLFFGMTSEVIISRANGEVECWTEGFAY